ncbi:MAG: GTPase HflX [Opitutales bacterium]|nr:GTPase HflX [Opitutales bacterium]
MLEVKEKPKMVERAFLVGAVFPRESMEEGEQLLDELEELVETLGIQVEHKELVKAREHNPKFLLGTGKTEELIGLAKAKKCDVIIFDNELSPSQQRNWESMEEKVAVIDRQEIILDIFNVRAQTREARLQVELARAEYNLPRLQRAWTHLDRQRGGGATQRDAGETQLELDQRMVREQIARLKRELGVVVKQREVQRKQRRKKPVPSGAFVGYTNAGKSSLLNKMSGADVLAEDKLFATLDPTSRRTKLQNGQHLVLTDTVGFVRRLPHRLVEAFKATLEESIISDFLVHVVDLSNPDYEHHIETTEKVLEELGATDKQIILAFNKIDQVDDPALINHIQLRHPDACLISAHTGEGLESLQDVMVDRIAASFEELRLLIPHERYDLVSQLYREGAIITETIEDDGYHLSAKIPDRIIAPYRAFCPDIEEKEPEPWER